MIHLRNEWTDAGSEWAIEGGRWTIVRGTGAYRQLAGGGRVAAVWIRPTNRARGPGVGGVPDSSVTQCCWQSAAVRPSRASAVSEELLAPRAERSGPAACPARADGAADVRAHRPAAGSRARPGRRRSRSSGWPASATPSQPRRPQLGAERAWRPGEVELRRGRRRGGSPSRSLHRRTPSRCSAATWSSGASRGRSSTSASTHPTRRGSPRRRATRSSDWLARAGRARLAGRRGLRSEREWLRRSSAGGG